MGHLIDLKKSKEAAGPYGTLIIGILTDEAVMEKKPRPIISFKERFEIAASENSSSSAKTLRQCVSTWSIYNGTRSLQT